MVHGEAEFVIVGGGVFGCAVGWGLAKRGASVVLLERHKIASGASGGPGERGIGSVHCDLRELPFMRRAHELWPELESLIGGPTGYRRLGSIRSAEFPDERELEWVGQLMATATTHSAAGIETYAVGRDELTELLPGVGGAVRMALYCPVGGVACHEATTRSFAMAAQRQGAQVLEGIPVTEIKPGNGARGQIETAGGQVFNATRAIIVLANTYASRLLQTSLGFELPIWRRTAQMSFVQPPAGFELRRYVMSFNRPLAIKQVRDGTVMISGGQMAFWDETLDCGVAHERHLLANLADAIVVLPNLEGSVPVGMDASRTESRIVDALPIVDTLPGASNVFVGVGWCGHGFSIAPGIAEGLVDWALSGRKPENFEPFNARRYPQLMNNSGALK